MGFWDIVVIGLYFAVVIGLGFWYEKRASRNLEAYFLGGKSMNWLFLAMSGSVSTFDITGTMWIVSLLFILGMRSMWVHWMWGFMMGAFFMAYMGKWVRRSNVMTAAEWMVTRFGTDGGGKTARTAYAFMAVITLTSFIGYAFQGIGKFASVYLPFQPGTCAVLIIGTTTLYVLLGGLYSVVITQVIQTMILTFAGILIAAVAYVRLTPETIAAKIPPDWTSLVPVWRLGELSGTEHAGYEMFGALVIVWVLKGLFLNAGGPAQMYDFQFFLASRNPRDASKLGAAWSFFLIIRWGMCAGIALLALAGVGRITDPEQAMPLVLKDFLPVGIRGIVIAGLLAAFMSTFAATVNSAASFVVRDFIQPFLHGGAGERTLVAAGRISTVLIVATGIAVGYQATSIAQIWNWIMMALGAGVIMPNVLRWYWWRMTGWGYAAGTLAGVLLSLGALFYPDAPMYVIFPPIVAGSLAAGILVSIWTPPVDEEILVGFYRTVRPFGIWGPVREKSGLTPAELSSKPESPSLAVLNTCLGMVAVTGYYLFPMYLTGHWHGRAALWLCTALAATVVLAFTWYRNLPPEEEAV